VLKFASDVVEPLVVNGIETLFLDNTLLVTKLAVIPLGE
jgi:hypothetical protein